MPKAAARAVRVRFPSSKIKTPQLSPLLAADTTQRMAIVVFPHPAGPVVSVLVPRSRPPPVSVSNSLISLGTALIWTSPLERAAIRARKYDYSTCTDHVIVKTFLETASAQLCYFQPPSRVSVIAGQFFKRDNAMYDAMQLEIAVTHYRSIIKQQHGASTF